MCGIIGYVGPGAGAEIVIKGLERLEYRGYDSAVDQYRISFFITDISNNSTHITEF